jgi:hypothetical protein
MSNEGTDRNVGPAPANSGEQNVAGGNRGRRFNRRGNYRNHNQRGYNSMRFEGREPSLRGHIYDWTGERNPDQFIKTTKEITNYVGHTYTKYTADFMEAVRVLELEDPEEPEHPAPDDQDGAYVWKYNYKEYQAKLQEFSNFRAGLYNVVLGQCTDALQDKLKSHTDFPGAYQDGIALLKIIKVLTYSFEDRRKLSEALCEIKETFYAFKQGRNMSLQQYYELFLNQVEVLDEVGVNIADDSLINTITAANGHDKPTEEDLVEAREQALAICFIRGANDTYTSYRAHLRNSFLDENDLYPSTLHQAYNIMQR